MVFKLCRLQAGIGIRGFSLSKACLGVGLTLTTVSFGEYFFQDGGAGLSSLGFIYGIPITLIGCSLQYAELEPVRDSNFLLAGVGRP